MPVTGSGQSTVTVQVPVPTPVQQTPKRPTVSFGAPKLRPPSSTADDDTIPPHAAGSLSAVILPWNPQGSKSPQGPNPTQLTRSPRRLKRVKVVLKYAGELEVTPERGKLTPDQVTLLRQHLETWELTPLGMLGDSLTESGYPHTGELLSRLATGDPGTGSIHIGEYHPQFQQSPHLNEHEFHFTPGLGKHDLHELHIETPKSKGGTRGQFRVVGSKPAPTQMRRLPRRVARYSSTPMLKKYGRTEVDHTPFHNKIVENTREDTPNLVYADFLEENGMPQLAAFIREIIRVRQDWRINDRKGSVLHVEKTGPLSVDTRPERVNTVFAYDGIGRYWERVGRKKPNPTIEVSVKSPSPNDPTGYIVHALDVPPTEAHQWMKRLVAEGHPTGNEARSGALSRAADEARRENPELPSV